MILGDPGGLLVESNVIDIPLSGCLFNTVMVCLMRVLGAVL